MMSDTALLAELEAWMDRSDLVSGLRDELRRLVAALVREARFDAVTHMIESMRGDS